MEITECKVTDRIIREYKKEHKRVHGWDCSVRRGTGDTEGNMQGWVYVEGLPYRNWEVQNMSQRLAGKPDFNK